jgi:hypothetical protein
MTTPALFTYPISLRYLTQHPTALGMAAAPAGLTHGTGRSDATSRRVRLVSDSDDDDPGVRILVHERAHCERTLPVHADRECRD